MAKDKNSVKYRTLHGIDGVPEKEVNLNAKFPKRDR
jgi:hypothetical protein